jgi:hypothetical protein
MGDALRFKMSEVFILKVEAIVPSIKDPIFQRRQVNKRGDHKDNSKKQEAQAEVS